MSNQIKYNGTTYEGNHIRSGSLYLSEALASAELEADVMNVVVKDESTRPQLLAADGRLAAAGGTLLIQKVAEHGIDYYGQYGQRVDLYHNDTLVAPLYLTDIIRVARYEYQLNCISGVGLLLTSDHYGGIYSGQTCGSLVSDIIGGIVPYTIDATLAATPMYGWLPIAPRRDNLRNVLFAVGGQIRKDTTGKINIIPQTSPTPYPVTGDELYLGGSVTGGNPATGVSLTEHTYLALDQDERVTIFDGEASAEALTTPKGRTVVGVLISFDEPMHGLSIENADILESDANYAVISSSPAAILTGQRYTHVTRLLSRAGAANRTPNIITSEECGLISLFNSELVADRLMAYYGAARTIETDLALTTQKPGDAVTFTDPFGEQAEGYISSMDVNISNTLMARTTIISGFIPTASGNYYSHLAVLTGAGSWTVPAECKGKIRVVLIGGGQGGQGGQGGAGAKWKSGSSHSSGDQLYMADNDGIGAAGGESGAPGEGGKVFIQTLAVTIGQVIPYSVGAGGTGGAGGAGGVLSDMVFVVDPSGKSGDNGNAGEPSVFGGLSSENGKPMSIGYTEVTTGTTYGISGIAGIKGGHGGGVYGYPRLGESVGDWAGGNPGRGSGYGDSSSPTGYAWVARGGGGGGAAFGANGYDGANVAYDDRYSEEVYDTGVGGNGASAIKANAGTIPGQGGQGGHGGGGAGHVGGGHGGTRTSGNNTIAYVVRAGFSSTDTASGDGGHGGTGGDGAPGVILIYY